jgi:hypothetical protein
MDQGCSGCAAVSAMEMGMRDGDTACTAISETRFRYHLLSDHSATSILLVLKTRQIL